MSKQQNCPKEREMTREEFIHERREMAQLNISELIERLTSPNLRTRFLAEMCLRDQTST